MANNPTKISIELTAPVVRDIVASLTEEQRIEITRGVMSNVVQTYLHRMTNEQVAALEKSIDAQIALTVNSSLQSSGVVTRVESWSGTTTRVQLPEYVLTSIRNQTREAVHAAAVEAAKEAVCRATERLSDSVHTHAVRSVKMVIDTALAEYTAEIKTLLKAALK